jgi:hypothetical protein
MKNLLFTFLTIAFISILTIGCEEEELKRPEPVQSKVTVQFAAKQVTHPENGAEKVVVLTFSKTATQEGTIKIQVDTTQAKYFNSNPLLVNGFITLQVKENDNSASFRLTPKDNSLADGPRQIVFRINEVSENFAIGIQPAFSLTIQDDDTEVPAQESYANFIAENATIRETLAEGHSLSIHLSESATVSGSLTIEAVSSKALYGTHYTTEPAFDNGRLTLTAEPGTSVVTFKVIPLDNTIINGELELSFTITGTTGNIKKGSSLVESFKITDDELENMPKGYEVGGGSWTMKRIIEYDENGRVYKVHITEAFPSPTTRTETYYYNASGLLEKINTHTGIDKVFIYTGDRITKSEIVHNGVVKQYNDYEYDEYGNVAGAAYYYRQVDGSFALGSLNVYLYFFDGNVYKTLIYTPIQGSDEYNLIATRTYDNYIDKENPFPMVDILPNVKSQTKLPTTYKVEEGGVELNYNLIYEFRNDGLVGKRMAVSGNSVETAVYLYY